MFAIMRTLKRLSCPRFLFSFIWRIPRPFLCSIGWTVFPPKRKISVGYALSVCAIWGMNCAVRKRIYLRDGIYELRVGLRGMNYRMLYFFHERVAAVLAHGLIKEREVPPREIDEAIRRKRRFELDPERHTYKEG